MKLEVEPWLSSIGRAQAYAESAVNRSWRVEQEIMLQLNITAAGGKRPLANPRVVRTMLWAVAVSSPGR